MSTRLKKTAGNTVNSACDLLDYNEMTFFTRRHKNQEIETMRQEIDRLKVEVASLQRTVDHLKGKLHEPSTLEVEESALGAGE